MTRALLLLLVGVAPLAFAACENRFELAEEPLVPEQAAVVAMKLSADVRWSPVEGAESYRVYHGTDADRVAEGVDADLPADSVSVAASPLVLSSQLVPEAGRRYYIAVAAVVAGEEGPVTEVLSVEPMRLDAPFDRGIEVNAGLTRTVSPGDDGERIAPLLGAGFFDAEGLDPEEYFCNVAWNDGEDAHDTQTDPCNLEEPTVFHRTGRFQPVLTVESSSGRIGEALTTVHVR